MDELIRAQLREALDIERPDPGLRYRVIAAAYAEGFRRTRRGLIPSGRRRFAFRLRAAATLLATVLVILLVGSTLAGGRLLRDWNAFVRRPAPAATDVHRAELKQVEAVPLVLPLLAAGEACPLGPASALVGYGGNPVSGLGAWDVTSDSWGFYFRATFFLKSGRKDLVLMRGRSLTSGAPVVFVGKYATGPVVGSDVVGGTRVSQTTELVLDPSQPPPFPPIAHNVLDPGDVIGYDAWQITYGMTSVGSGNADCVGWQIDSLGFPTERFVAPASMFQPSG